METNWIPVRVEKDGRICVPKTLREHYGIKPGDKVDIKIRKEEKE